jgi:hypothetical protein
MLRQKLRQAIAQDRPGVDKEYDDMITRWCSSSKTRRCNRSATF